ncbi:MAG: hypothetical protein WKF88_09295 [Ferruginibacter sp.]
MGFDTIGTYACRALQADYVDFYQKNSPEFKTGGSTALIKYLLSPQNTRGFRKIDVKSIPGKKRPVAFMIDSPFCFDVCNPAVTCTTTKQVLSNPAKEIVFDLDGDAFRVCDVNGDPMVLQFSREDLAKYCTTDDNTYIQRQVMRYLKRFEEALDKKLAELIAVAGGTDASGSSLVRMPFFVNNTITNTSALNQDAFWHLAQNYLDIQGEGQFGLIGGKIVNKIAQYNKWSALNMAGIDLSKIDDINPYSYYDRNMDGILGQNGFLQLSPGAVQLVTYNENDGPYKTEVTGLYSNGSIVSPSTGLTLDWDWRYDYECKVWKFEAYLHAELAVNAAGGCGDLATTNGIIRYEDCSGTLVAPPCPDVPVV